MNFWDWLNSQSQRVVVPVFGGILLAGIGTAVAIACGLRWLVTGSPWGPMPWWLMALALLPVLILTGAAIARRDEPDGDRYLWFCGFLTCIWIAMLN